MADQSIHLEHVFITVRDAGASLDFYRKLFPDWVVRWEGPSADGGRWIHFGPAGDGRPGYLSLHESRGAVRPDEGYASHRIQHVGFSHPDVDGLRDRLAEEGIPVDDSTDDGKYRRHYFLDPNGIEVEFVQEM
ncbi:MAG: VOC family protein [Acidobacteria bacterium]|nr:VOC family protein [Acidobacteriota bacterium]